MYDLLKCNTDLHSRSGRYSTLNLICARFNRETEEGRTLGMSAQHNSGTHCPVI